METVKDRVLQIIAYERTKKKKYTVREFQEKIGVSGSYIINMVNSISTDVATRIIHTFPYVSLRWLIMGEGEMIVQEEEEEEKKTLTAQGDNEQTLIDTPHYNQSNGAISTLREHIKNSGLGSIVNSVDIAITIANNAMHDVCPKDSIVFGHRVMLDDMIEWGELYAIKTTNGIFVRNLFVGENANEYILRATNELFPDVVVTSEAITELYKIVGIVQRK